MGWRRGARVTGSERDPGTRTSRARARARARPAPRASPKNTQVLAQEPGERGRVTPLYLAKRKGFVALALAHGAPLVPAFTFGLERCYGALFPRLPALSARRLASRARRCAPPARSPARRCILSTSCCSASTQAIIACSVSHLVRVRIMVRIRVRP